MGVFGQGPETSTEKHFCKNCGKEIKPGQHFTKDGDKFCCETCCETGGEKAKKEAKVCEFC